MSDAERQWQEKKIDLMCERGVAKSHLYNLRSDADYWTRQAAARIVALTEAQLRDHEASRP